MRRAQESPRLIRPGPMLALLLAFTAPVRGASPARAPQPPVDAVDLARLPSHLFTDRDGLPQNSILRMSLDARGRLWVGTLDGAAFYDGRGWTAVGMPRRTVSNQVNAVLGSTDGSVWFGTSGGGLAQLREGDWRTFDARSGLPGNTVRSLLETGTGAARALWVGTDRGLARLQGGRWTTFEDAPGPVRDVVLSLLATTSASGQLVLWVGTGAGLARLEGERWTTFDTGSGLPHAQVLSLLETRSADGTPTLWAGTVNGLARLRDGRWTTFDARSGLPPGRIEALVEVGPPERRVVWAACFGGGLARWDGRWVTFGEPAGLPNTRLRSLLETTAADGSTLLWVGTAAGGLVRFKPDGWRTFDRTTGLPSRIVRCFLETLDPDGAPVLWIGTAGGGLARVHRGRWTVMDGSNGLPNDQVLALAETRGRKGASTVWIGTEGGGLARVDGGRLRTDAAGAGFRPDTINAVLATTNAKGDPVLWVGTGSGTHVRGSGLGRLEDGRWTIFTSASGLPHDSVNALLETARDDGTRALWVGTPAGLARWEADRWTVYDRRQGLPNDHVRSLHEVRAEGGGRRLWVGTLGGGVAFADWTAATPTWTTLSDATTPALPNNVIYQVRSDRLGRVYLFTNKGVARLTSTSGRAGGFAVEVFDREDGLPSDEFNSGASMVDARGRVWAGCVQGAVVLDPSPPPPRRPAPFEVRAVVSTRGRALVRDEGLPYEDNDLEFESTLASLFREGQTRYRTQLVGLETVPTEWSPESRARYARLPAGRYVFRAWARDYAGAVVGPRDVPFSVRPTAWGTWPAYAAYVLAFVALAGGTVRWRVEALHRRNAALQTLVNQRTAELAATVEELRASEHRAVELKDRALESERQARAASEAKTVFIANMSHELKTPLNAVLGFAQLMERRRERDVDDREHLSVIHQNAEHLLGLINDILSLGGSDAALAEGLGTSRADADADEAGETPLTRERIRTLPPDWRSRFHAAVDRGDPIEAAELTREVESLDSPLVAAIRARLEAYRLDELEEMFRPEPSVERPAP